jgi:hypothetical protein
MMSKLESLWNGQTLYEIVQREVGPSIVGNTPIFARMMVRAEMEKTWAALPLPVRDSYSRAAGLIVCHSEDVAALLIRALKCPKCNPGK